MEETSLEVSYVRGLLRDWADWLGHAGGYPHQSSIEWFRNGGISSSSFGPALPKDVEPSLPVAKTSIALQHLRAIDGESAALLEAVYLRKATVTLAMLAKKTGVGLTVYQARRRKAEQKLVGLLQSIGFFGS